MTAFLFPGQGSQKPGMCRKLHDASPAARDAFAEMARLHGEGGRFLSLLFHGGEAALNDTRNAQPALLAAGWAVFRHLGSLGLRPSLCAGHSLGEISALAAAGALDPADAMRLVRERARLMCGDVPEGGMAAVLGLDPDKIAEALPAGVQVANYNGPAQTIISGARAALDAAAEALKNAGAKRVLPLKVSGPFHSEWMRPAADKLARFLEGVPLETPRCPFVSSVSGREESAPDSLRRLLAEQLCGPVRWTEVMRVTGAVDAVEAGPGTVLAGLAKRMEGAPTVWPAETPEQCDAAARELSKP